MSINKIKIGISIGDINGVGPEIILKTFSDTRMLDVCTPIIYGSSKVLMFYKKLLELTDFNFLQIASAADANSKRVNLKSCWEDDLKIEPGNASVENGQFAFKALEAATIDLKDGLIDALCTAPIDKHSIQNKDFQFAGHTEYLQEKLGGTDSLMLLCSEELKVGVVTGHIPIMEVAKKISKELIERKITLLNASLKADFAITRTRIAILGLNPHAGDKGVIGKEEIDIIIPAIESAKNNKVLAFGPYSADGFFGNELYKKFDGVLAMYHDQGLIPFKTISFNSGVNFTAGLDFVRTSPDHGTAYDIAGKSEASISSFREAIYMAVAVVRNRLEYSELTERPLKITKLARDRGH